MTALPRLTSPACPAGMASGVRHGARPARGLGWHGRGNCPSVLGAGVPCALLREREGGGAGAEGAPGGQAAPVLLVPATATPRAAGRAGWARRAINVCVSGPRVCGEAGARGSPGTRCAAAPLWPPPARRARTHGLARTWPGGGGWRGARHPPLASRPRPGGRGKGPPPAMAAGGGTPVPGAVPSPAACPRGKGRKDGRPEPSPPPGWGLRVPQVCFLKFARKIFLSSESGPPLRRPRWPPERPGGRGSRRLRKGLQAQDAH